MSKAKTHEHERTFGDLRLPISIWREIVEFRARKKSGQVILHFQHGEIRTAQISQYISGNDEASQPSSS